MHYTTYCGRNELITTDDLAIAAKVGLECLTTSPASLVHIRRESDGLSVTPNIAEDHLAHGWSADEIFDGYGRNLDGEAL